MTRSRAADDFATIRARLDELRRERAQVSAGQEGRSSFCCRPPWMSGCRNDIWRALWWK
jgi:hypothetical protein